MRIFSPEMATIIFFVVVLLSLVIALIFLPAAFAMLLVTFVHAERDGRSAGNRDDCGSFSIAILVREPGAFVGRQYLGVGSGKAKTST